MQNDTYSMIEDVASEGSRKEVINFTLLFEIKLYQKETKNGEIALEM